MSALLHKKIRVFWHEMGHFVAACYNQQYFNSHETDKIVLTFNDNVNDYYGELYPCKPDNYIPQHTAHPAAWVATLAYGCIFQAIQQPNGNFMECFDWKGHGKEDIDYVTSLAEKIAMHAEEKRPLFSAIEYHYEEIAKNQEFIPLFSQNVNNLLHDEKPVITIFPNQVKEIVVAFLPAHEHSYIKLVTTIDQIIKPYLL